jgi:hypothetical protein
MPPADTPEAKVVTFPKPPRMKNPAAVALGKLGGSKGGRIRAANLSPEARKSIAQRAAQARWAKASRERHGETPRGVSPEKGAVS